MSMKKAGNSRNHAISAWRYQHGLFGCQGECRKKAEALGEELQQRSWAALATDGDVQSLLWE